MRIVRSFLKNGTLLVLAAIVVLAYSSWGRPLWIDETLHFFFGALSPVEALQTISQTGGTGVNHGQTGFLFFINNLLLNVTGASLLALRLPSILAGALLLASAVQFIREKGFGWGWQALMIIGLAGQAGLMHYSGEARPYMLLASTTVATLAYYQLPQGKRRNWIFVLLGVYGVVVGFANHPYYPAMLVMILGFSIWTQWIDGNLGLRWSPIVHFVNLPLVGAGALVYVTMGAFTWMRGTPSFDGFDPWAFVEGPATAAKQFTGQHLELLGAGPEMKAALLALLVMSVATLCGRKETSRLLPPIVLIAVGVMSSLAFSLLSIMRSYWLFPRQWVAGLAIAAIGVVWLIAELSRLSTAHRSVFLRFATFLAITYVLVAGVSATGNRLMGLVEQDSFWNELAQQDRNAADLAATAQTNDEWVKAANVNILEGGPVHPNFRRYYGLPIDTAPE